MVLQNGYQCVAKSLFWSYPDFDDFIIYEYTFHNNGDANGDGQPDPGMPVQLNDVYFAFVNIMTISQAGCFISSRVRGGSISRIEGRFLQIHRCS